MQFAKDSFYVALRDRLANVNPARKIVLNGIERPAIIVPENEAATSNEPFPEAFYLYWGEAHIVKQQEGIEKPLLGFLCSIVYRSDGTTETGMDRGRAVGGLESDLLAICKPRWAPKCDYTQNPATELGTNIFWTPPNFGNFDEAGETTAVWRSSNMGATLTRRAKLTVFFFPEVNA